MSDYGGYTHGYAVVHSCGRKTAGVVFDPANPHIAANEVTQWKREGREPRYMPLDELVALGWCDGKSCAPLNQAVLPPLAVPS